MSFMDKKKQYTAQSICSFSTPSADKKSHLEDFYADSFWLAVMFGGNARTQSICLVWDRMCQTIASS